jgi:hypothetical protein
MELRAYWSVYGLDDRGLGTRFPTGVMEFLLHNFKAGSYTTSYPMKCLALTAPCVREPRHYANHWLHDAPLVSRIGICGAISPFAYTSAWHRESTGKTTILPIRSRVFHKLTVAPLLEKLSVLYRTQISFPSTLQFYFPADHLQL